MNYRLALFALAVPLFLAVIPVAAQSPKNRANLSPEVQALRKEVQTLRKQRDQAWVRGIIKDTAVVNEKVRAEVQSVFGNLTTMLGLLMGMLGLLPLVAAILAFYFRGAIIQSLAEKTEAGSRIRLEKEIEDKTSELAGRIQVLEGEHSKDIERLRSRAGEKVTQSLAELEVEYKARLDERFEGLVPYDLSGRLSKNEVEEMRRIKTQIDKLRKRQPELFDDVLSEQKRKIKLLMAAGDYQEAADEIAGALKNRKDDGELYALEARSHWYLEQFESAIDAARRAMSLGNVDSVVYGVFARANSNLGNHDEAITSLHQALKVFPNDDFLYALLGDVFANANQSDKSMESYGQALALNPRQTEALFNRSCLYARMGEYDLALEDLKRAIELEPDLRKDAREDKDFASLRDDPRFQELVKEPQQDEAPPKAGAPN